MEDKATGYNGSVTLDASNGDKIESVDGKVVSYTKNGVTYNWDKNIDQYWDGSCQMFSQVKVTASRPRTISQIVRRQTNLNYSLGSVFRYSNVFTRFSLYMLKHKNVQILGVSGI